VPGTVINRITAKDLSGRIETIEIVNPRGHMKNVMDDDDTNAKFLRLTETIIGKLTASEALDKLWHLETIPDASVLFELLDIPAAH
jgi:2-methylcitrate dehydratase PrpD